MLSLAKPLKEVSPILDNLSISSEVASEIPWKSNLMELWESLIDVSRDRRNNALGTCADRTIKMIIQSLFNQMLRLKASRQAIFVRAKDSQFQIVDFPQDQFHGI